jgi:signal transduction histidine kinase
MKIDQLTSYFSQCHDAYWVFSQDYKLIFANGASHTLTGWSPEKFANRHWCDLNAALQKICAENQRDLFQWDCPPDQPSFASFQLLSPKPRMICRYVQKVALSNESVDQVTGEEVVFVMTFRDLTREMNLEVAKSNFLSNAAHELRTPMSSVLGFTELLLNNPYSQERTLRTLGIIHRQAQRTVDLINELLDLSRIESQQGMHFELQSFHLRKQIMAVIGGLHPSQSQRVIVIDEQNFNHWVDIDEAKFQMAFLNILSNAMKYSPNDKPVHVRIHQNITEEKNWIGVEVKDLGVGIKSEDISKLFTRFFRAEPTSNISGTGLGLHLVKEIMEQMGGKVEIQSQYGEGTQATLWLPQSKSSNK